MNKLFTFRFKWILLIFIFSVINNSVFANGAVDGDKAIVITKDGGAKTLYKVYSNWSYGACSGYNTSTASTLSNLGNLNTLVLNGIYITGWTNNSDWVAGRIEWKIWSQSGSEPGSATGSFNVGGYGSACSVQDVVCSSGNNRFVGMDNQSVDLLSGFTAGNYYLKIYPYGQLRYNCGSWNQRNDATLQVTFTINPIVTFNSNGGTGSMSNQNVTYNTATALTANSFTRSGYTFNGWNTAANGSGTSYANSANVTLTANTTLYAQWTAVSSSPTVTTTSISNITSTTASSGGTVTSNGGSSVTAEGVCWNTTGSPTTTDSKTSDGTSTPFTSSLSSLSAQTKYYVRAYATNSVGTGYASSDLTFYTLSSPATAGSFAWGTNSGCGGNAVLNWSSATFPGSGATTKGYVLLRATSPNTPTLGNSNGAAPTAGSNTTIVSSTIASSTTTYTDTPTSGSTYVYLLVPFTWDGTNAATYNYLTSLSTTSVAVSSGVTWLGGTSTDWGTAANWCGGVPTSSTDVTIPSGTTYSPTVSSGAVAKSVTINSGATLNGGANTLTISGNFSNNGTFSAGTGTVVFSGTATVDGSNAITFNNLTLNGATTMTTAPSVSGILLVNNASASISTNRVTYNTGSTLEFAVSKTIGSGDMFWETNISSTGSSQKGVPWNVTVDASQTLTFSDTYPYYMNGNMLINGSLILGGNGSTHWGNLYLRGNFTNNGTFTHNTREVIFNGASAQTINGTLNATGTTNCFAYLTINNTSGGVTLNNPVNVINKLTLTSGIVTTSNTNILNITATDASNSLSGGSSTSFINGPLKRAFTSGTASDWIFPVGKGTTFLPCVINTPTGTSPITAEAFASNCGGSSTGYALSTSEYWQISGNTLTAGYVSLAKAGTSASVVAYSSASNGTYTSLGGSSATVCSVTGIKAASTANPLIPNCFALASATEPTTQATVLAFSNVTSSGMTLTWTNGNGSNRVVVAKQGSAPTGTPADGTAYTANAAYGTSGTSLGDGFVVYNGNSNTVNATGLTAGTTYYFAVYEYNGSGTSSNYLTTTPATGNQMTLAAATITATPTSATYSAQVGETSASQSFAITGSNLTTDITVTAPAYYQVSTDNSTWSASAGSVTFTQTAGSVSGTLYVRYVPTAGEASVAKNVTLASTGATTVNIAVTGTAAKTITIKFKKPTTEWTSTPYIYAWNGGTITPSAVAVWQGVQMNDIGSGWYSYTLSFTNTTVNFKFNIGVAYQSSNITGISTSSCWVSTDADGAPSVAYTTISADCPNNMYYRSVASGDWNSTTSWEQSVDNATWVAASSVPSSSANGVLISTNNTVTVSSGVTSPSSASFIVNGTLSFTASSATVSTAPTYSSGSTLKYALGTGNSRSVGTEWTANATSLGAGCPQNVEVTSGRLKMTNASFANKYYAIGNLSVKNGAIFDMDVRYDSDVANHQGKVVVTFTGDITIDTGGKIEYAGENTTLAGNLAFQCHTMTNNGTLSLSNNTDNTRYLQSIGGDLYLTGDFIENNTFNCNGRALIFIGTENQKIDGSSNSPFAVDFMAVVKTSGTVTMYKDVTCKGYSSSGGGWWALNMTGGSLNLNGHSLIVSAADGSGTIGSSGINCSGTAKIVGSATSSISLLGNRSSWTANNNHIVLDQTTPGITNSLKDLIINRTDSASLTDKVYVNTVYIYNSLQIKASEVTIDAVTLDSAAIASISSTVSTAKLNVNGNLIFTRSLNSSSEFYPNGRTLNIGGTVQTKVHFARLGKWHFISFPYDVTIKKSDNSTSATIGTSSSDGDLAVYWYDPAKRATNISGWTQLTTGGSTLTAGKAYIMAKRNTYEDLYFNPNSSVQGGNNFFTTPQLLSVTYTTASAPSNAGWNFVAQPISVASLPTLTDGEFAYNYNAANDQYKLYFYEYNPGYSYTGGSIKPFSSVFVKTAAAGNVSFGSSTPQGIIRKKISTENPESVIPLRLNVNSIEYETLIRVKADATIGQDELYDAPYSTPMSSSTPRLYSLVDGVSYSLNSVPEGSTIPLGLRVPTAGTYSFTWDAPTNGLQPTLIDSQGTTTDMTTNTSYEFSTSTSGDINTRFLITVPKRVVTNIDVTNKSEYKIHSEFNKISIEGLNIPSKVQLFDVTGKLIQSKYVTNNMSFNVTNKGIYILQISNKNGNQSLKVVVH